MARKRPEMKLVLSLVLFLGVAAQAATPAQANVTMSVSPVRLELSAAPGARGEPEITVANLGSETFNVAATLEPYEGAEIEASAFDWIQIDPPVFSLEPGSEQAVKVRLAVPSNIPTGGYYARVSFATVPDPDDAPAEGGAQVTVARIRAGVLITVQGNGELTIAATVERLIPVLEPDGRVGFRVLLHNEGNIHLLPEGLIEVSQDDGPALASLEVPAGTPLLPANQALMLAHGTLPLEPGADYEASVLLDIGADEPVTADAAFQVEAAQKSPVSAYARTSTGGQRFNLI